MFFLANGDIINKPFLKEGFIGLKWFHSHNSEDEIQQEDIDNIEDNVNDLSKEVKTQEEDINDIEGSVYDLGNEMQSVEEDIGIIEDNLNSIGEGVDTNKEDINSLKNDLSNLNVESKIQDKISGFDQKFSNLQEIQDEMNQQISNINHFEENVGIGIKPNDEYKLDVNGNVRVSGSIQTNGELTVGGKLSAPAGLKVGFGSVESPNGTIKGRELCAGSDCVVSKDVSRIKSAIPESGNIVATNDLCAGENCLSSEDIINIKNVLANPAQPANTSATPTETPPEIYHGPYYHLYNGGCSGIGEKDDKKKQCQDDEKCKAIGLQSNNCWHFLTTPENKSNSGEQEKNISSNYPKHFEKIR